MSFRIRNSSVRRKYFSGIGSTSNINLIRSIAKEAGVDLDQLSAKISQCQKTFEYDYEDWYELHYPDGSGLEITCDNDKYFFL